MDCYVCEGCGNTLLHYIRICPICRGEKTMALDVNGLLRRLLVNIVSTITPAQLQEMVLITGMNANISHDTLFTILNETIH